MAAWIFARELGLADMVACTVLREDVPLVGGGEATASVQVIWPQPFTPDHPGPFPEDDRWRAGIFDAVIAHADRGHNRPGLGPDPGGEYRLKLVDHHIPRGRGYRPFGGTLNLQEDAMLHVEIIQNEWAAGRQRVVGRVILDGTGHVSLEPVDSGWEASALLPFVDPDSGEELTPTGSAERFVRALHMHLKGDYLFATEAHEAGECGYRIGEELPLNPISTEARTAVH